MSKKVYLYLLLLCCNGCFWTNPTASPLAPTEYTQWIENPSNGMLISKAIGDFQFKLQYKPHEYLAIKELKQLEFEGIELQKKIEAMQEMQYFTFEIGKKDGSNFLKSNIEYSGDYSKNIEYLSFKLQNDLSLVEQGDTLPCILHHFERSYGINPNAKIVLAFPELGGELTDKTFVYNDSHFGVGIVKMTISEQALQNIPKIKTK